MLVLRSSPASPFGRKVKIAAELLGLRSQITVENADTMDPEEPLRRQNPLGKIPALVLETGDTLYDSRVILEYLDMLAGGGRIIPAGGWERFDALRRQALADGIMDAAVLQVYEVRRRPVDRRHQPWLDDQAEKVERGLAAATPHAQPTIDVGHIALACALGYLDLRFEGRWRAAHPGLVAWLSEFEARVPAYAATRMAA